MNSRQQQILLLLVQSTESITLSEIADKLEISIRTVQRELVGLDDILHQYGLVLNKKTGIGISLEGDEEAKKKLFQYLTMNKFSKIFSPEERQYLLIQMLLTLKEPTKLYYFSNKFNVTEATISNDLSRIEPWFEKHRIKLIRKPGFGVYIEGSEKDIRQAMIDLLYQYFTQEQLMEILSSYTYPSTDKVKMEFSIRNRLLHFIDVDTIGKIEQVVQKTCHWGYDMTDSAYVGFVIHIALAIQRLRNGEKINIAPEILGKLKQTREFSWAEQMSQELGTLLKITIPESEIGYITMHLLGSKMKRIHSVPLYVNDLEKHVWRMVQIVGKELKIDLENDETLMEHLSTHLESAIHRIKLQMDIRNPLLRHIKEKYPDIYAAAYKAATYLEQQIKCSIPEEEVGYLAMHFGAAVVRKKHINRNRYRAVLVCTSGIGTSRFLATQIEKELPHIQIADTVSLLRLEEWINSNPPVDLIISTIPFQYKGQPVTVVNPLLLPQDIEMIEKQLKQLKKGEENVMTENEEITDTILKVNRYGEGIVHLLENIFLLNGVEASTKELVIKQVSEYVQAMLPGVNGEVLREELRKREEIGGWVLEEHKLAMLHCRSDATGCMCICLVKLKDPVNWGGVDVPAVIHNVLVLLAPRSAPKEHIELISEVSAALIDDEFVKVLTGGDFATITKTIKAVLRKGYQEKIEAVLRGNI